MDSGFAPAKVNLALHVTGRRADGYHLLDSLVVFAGIGDQISATPAREMSLGISGAFTSGIPVGGDNLVMRAARLLADKRRVRIGAAIRLAKALPSAAGIGGGSSDAAATIRLLARLWKVAPLRPDDPDVLALGADVPVCLAAPAPQRMAGIGEILSPCPPLPRCALVLVNPRVEVPTADVFRRLPQPDNPPLDTAPPSAGTDGFAALVDWLARQRNDLAEPAQEIAPEITRVIARLTAAPGVALARMSGSGATCYGLCPDLATAKRVAKAIQIGEQGWWVAPAPVLAPVSA